MKNKRKKQFFLSLGILGILAGTAVWGVQKLRSSIPDALYVTEKEENALDNFLDCPFITTSDTVEASSGGKYVIECRLFDRFLIKRVTITQAQPMCVGVSGDTIGIYMETDGVLVIDTQEILSSGGKSEEPAKNLIQPGDYIQKVNGTDIEKKSELVSEMEENTGEKVVLEINRGGEVHSVSVEPVCAQDGSYKLGIWVRDNTQGIGTLTYVREDGRFGALGHGISDMDMGDLLKLDQGDLYRAEVISIKKGLSGSPGELAGLIRYQKQEHLGRIETNDTCGIYGTMDDSILCEPVSSETEISADTENTSDTLSLKWYEVGYKQDLQEGPADIVCSLGDGVTKYQIEIEDIYWDAADSNKCFVIRVTDPDLLEKTGGIVQGMSGSPIIQDGKLVGAVTHVLVNDPTRGYGIFIENMLDAAE